MGETFVLIYRERFLGTISTDLSDFPSTSGQIYFNMAALDEEKELSDYIDFSVKSAEKKVGDSRAYEDFIKQEESKHRGVIDNPEWFVISEEGIRTRISVPIFFGEHGIVFTVR